MNAIILMAIGPKYELLLNTVLSQFQEYANYCGARLEICRHAPDPSMKYPIMTQKLLLPSIYSQYEWIAFIDLDILISKHAPSIFEQIKENMGFGAVLDPIGEKIYYTANLLWFNKKPNEILPTKLRFTNEGFSFDNENMGIINGGVWLANPKLISKIFFDYYYSCENSLGNHGVYEELAMSYLSQNSNLFFKIDKRFNSQLIYFSCEKYPLFNTSVIKFQKLINKFISANGKVINKMILLPPYINLVKRNLESKYFLHFSGGYPMPPID